MARKPTHASKKWLKDLVAWARREGLTQQAAASGVGIGKRTLVRWLSMHSVDWWTADVAVAPETEVKRVVATREWAQQLVAGAQANQYTVDRAAKELGMHRSTILRWLRHYDIAWWRSRRPRQPHTLPTPWAVSSTAQAEG